MLLNEYLKTGSIFSEIKKVNDFEFIGMDADVLDQLLAIEYGKRVMVESITNVPMSTVAKLIVKKTEVRWSSLIERELLLANVNNRREVTETIDGSEDRAMTNENVDKVAAYDSDDLIDSGGNSSNSNDESTSNRVRTMTDEMVDVKSSFELLNIKSKDTIIGAVIADVSSFLTLTIY